ncbi:hypothetical protein [Alkalicoccus luteus]|uniref:hypothetical protein n=1 Tax=Alkalicoccus luteus TaxID=1237094 RepID=UPI0040343F03
MDRIDSRYFRMGIRIFAVSLLIFVLIYSAYYLYVYMNWGLREGVGYLLLSDGIFLLLLPVAVLLFFLHWVGWWLAMIVFTYFLTAKVVGIAANFFLLQAGFIIDQDGGLRWGIELFYLFLYAGILIFLALRPIKSELGVHTGKMKIPSFWKIFPPAVLLYALQFYAAFQLMN